MQDSIESINWKYLELRPDQNSINAAKSLNPCIRNEPGAVGLFEIWIKINMSLGMLDLLSLQIYLWPSWKRLRAEDSHDPSFCVMIVRNSV